MCHLEVDAPVPVLVKYSEQLVNIGFLGVFAGALEETYVWSNSGSSKLSPNMVSLFIGLFDNVFL